MKNVVRLLALLIVLLAARRPLAGDPPHLLGVLSGGMSL